MKHFKTLMFVLTGLLSGLMPAAALAESLNPVGGNAWDLYVQGNGSAISQILTALKLVLAPAGGGGGFRVLLLAVAMLGFLALAVRAGFDPAKNFLKMFMFIILIAGVMYGTERATVNVNVLDNLSGYATTVTGVPAIVGLPAALVSEAGQWLTQEIEQDFSTPSGLKVSGGGQFDLFGKVLSDMNQMVITDPNLKASLSAYVNDCVVPEMALGKVTASQLVTSNDLLSVLGQANSNALMTRYYPVSGSTSTCQYLPPAGSYSPQLGALMECSQAYTCFHSDIQNYASSLLSATDQQWQTTGIMVPFETAMTDALAEASSAGSGTAIAGDSSPEGMILQTALVNSMRGSFRDAAARTGNNSLMLSTAIAQADQSQRTSWFTAAQIFKNLMGYVYIVLQAFIIGVVPVVIIALMIPGLGGKVFLNYIEVLVWLTLWSPIMAILNFIITVLGGSEMHNAVAFGFTMQNSATVSEYTNNLVIAAQFLGTMIPLLTWGLVKGSLAFTEFITHGIGSSFASQAGAQASTGNVSMGNDSINNVGMDKYNTSMSAEVGAGETIGNFGAGHVLNRMQQGGSIATADGQNATKAVTHSSSVTFTSENGKSFSMSYQKAKSFVDAQQKGLQTLSQYQSQLSNMASNLHKQMQHEIASQGHVSQDTLTAAQKVGEAEQLVSQDATKLSGGVGWKASAADKDGIPIVGSEINVHAGFEGSKTKSDTQSVMHDASTAYDHAIRGDSSYKTDSSVSDDGSAGSTATASASDSAAMSSLHSQTTQMNESMSRASSYTESLKKSMSSATTVQSVDPVLNNGSVGGMDTASAGHELAAAGTKLSGQTSGIDVAGAKSGFQKEEAQGAAALNRAAEGMTTPTGTVAGVTQTVAGAKDTFTGKKAPVIGPGAINIAWQKKQAAYHSKGGMFDPLTNVEGRF